MKFPFDLVLEARNSEVVHVKLTCFPSKLFARKCIYKARVSVSLPLSRVLDFTS